MSPAVLTIEGSKIQVFESFITEFNRVYAQFDVLWNGHLDAFNDYLAWPEEKYILVWKDSNVSREKLGHGEMIKWLEETIQTCHPSNVLHIRGRLEAAKLGEGQTMFDLLVEIIQSNSDYVQLRPE
jgi:hypothetical protein